MKKEDVRLLFRYSPTREMSVPLDWIPGSMIPRVGEFVCFSEDDGREEQAVRVLRVTYDLRHERRAPTVLVDVEQLSIAEYEQMTSWQDQSQETEDASA